MIFMTRRRFEEAVNRILYEEREERELRAALERLDRRITDLDLQMYNIRMKTDEEFRRKNSLTCECKGGEE